MHDGHDGPHGGTVARRAARLRRLTHRWRPLRAGGVRKTSFKQVIDNTTDPAMIFHGKAVAQRSSRPSIKLEDVGSNPTGLAALVVEERRLASVRPGRAEGGAALGGPGTGDGPVEW